MPKQDASQYTTKSSDSSGSARTDKDRTLLLNDRLCSLGSDLKWYSPPLTRSVKGVETPYPPTTVEEKLARKNELKARVHTAHGVSAASSKTNASNLPNVDSLSDAVIYSFFANGNVDYEIQKIHIENKKNLAVKETDTIGFDKTKVECYNFHIRGHFSKKCRATTHQDNRNREAPRRTVPVEDTTSNALVSQYTKVSTCSKACLKSYETLKEHYDNLTKDFNKSQFNLGAYKASLEYVEARLQMYKKNKTVFIDNIKILKLDVMLIDKAITELRQKFKKAKKERDDLKLNLEKFQDSSKNLSRLLDGQQSDKSKTRLGYDSKGVDSQVLENQVNDTNNTGEGYHAVLPPYIGNFMPFKPDLVFVDEHVVSESVTSLLGIAKSEVKTNEITLKNVSAPIIEDWVSDSEDEDEDEIETEKSAKKEENNRQTKYPRKNNQSPRVLTNSGLKTLNTTRHPSSRAAISVNTVRPISTTYPTSTVNDAKPSSNVFHKSHSPVRRTFNQRTTPNNSDLKEKVNTVKGKFTTVGTKAIVSVFSEIEKMLLSPQHAGFGDQQEMLLIISPKTGNPQYTLHDQGIFNRGCSRYMTRNKSFLTDYQEFDGGFVAFGESPKGGKIYRKGKIKTGKLDFKDVYFVKELKFNLFSVSQMCDKKNSVLFTETGCLVLSPDFKLLDENQVLLKVPKQNNMYSFDQKNVAPSGALTCLFAKATIDESNLWHRMLGYINFKTMKKLVRGKLVRGLPLNIFKNDHTCVACLKGKQYKASCKTKLVSFISQPLQMLHMDLFGLTFVKNLNKKMYCLVITDDFSRVLVTKPHNKTPYELLLGRSPNIDFMKPFGCPVTILNTLDHLGKFERKADEGFLVGRGPEWLFDIDSLTIAMNYEPVTVGNETKHDAGIEIHDNAGQARQEKASDHEYILLPFMPSLSTQSSNDKDADEVPGKGNKGVSKGSGIDDQERTDSNTQDVNIVRPSINTANININIVGFTDPNLDSGGSSQWQAGHWNQMGFRNKKDEKRIVIRNTARLVAQGYTQEKGIYYDEVFAHVPRIKAISTAKPKAAAHSRINSTERVNTIGSKAVSAIKGNGVTTVKASAGSSRSSFKNKEIVDSGCSRNMTRNKAYLADYQEINDGGFIAFGLSRGKITSKGKIRT
uniref:Putative ribonuclease H-like domain-containing protein n=1 Tax=Tanacetum cinerariifolium TaxID=118510 RepID=A0A699GPK6_TANCI|nr:putative ribonuclease H-like domain-containing protein [Tanacetum cinerariifolium]